MDDARVLKEAEVLHQLDYFWARPCSVVPLGPEWGVEYNARRERKPVQMLKHKGRKVRVASC